MHPAADIKQNCQVGFKASDGKLGVQDADVGGKLADSKSTSGGVLCTFGGNTCVPCSDILDAQVGVVDMIRSFKDVELSGWSCAVTTLSSEVIKIPRACL